MQRLRIGKSECLSFFVSGANTHLIEKTLAENEKLQKLWECHAELEVIGGGTLTAESGSFRFNLGSGKEGIYHKIRAVGMNNVTSAEFAEYDLNEIGKEFISSSIEQEKDYILPKTMGGSRVHLLLEVKNTRIQPVLLRVLSLGVGVYLSPFKDMWGSRIAFAGPSKSFTLANWEQQRKTVQATYSVKENYEKTNITGELRSEPIGKVKISHHISKIRISSGDAGITTDLFSSANSAESARVTVSTDDTVNKL